MRVRNYAISSAKRIFVLKPFRVYLAGKMGGRMGAEVLAERAIAVELCHGADIVPIDPAANEHVKADEIIDLKMDYVTMKNFVAKDEYAIRTCGALLILTGDSPSEGTGLEFGLALELGIPVVMVAPRRVKGELMGFWSIKASAIFSTVEEAVDFIAENYALR